MDFFGGSNFAVCFSHCFSGTLLLCEVLCDFPGGSDGKASAYNEGGLQIIYNYLLENLLHKGRMFGFVLFTRQSLVYARCLLTLVERINETKYKTYLWKHTWREWTQVENYVQVVQLWVFLPLSLYFPILPKVVIKLSQFKGWSQKSLTRLRLLPPLSCN